MQIDILNAQTRAALFHHGQEDAMIDRENHSITELGNQALVAGGTNTAGQTLNTLSLVDSSGATVTTDKLDYQPGQTAVISGTGWQAGELVDIILHEDPHTHTERRMTATADASGNFTANYLVEDHDLNITFIIGAKGQTSGRTAQTTFTDASIQITSINFNLTDMASSFTAGIPNSGGMNGRLRIQSRNNSFAAETVTGSGSFITVQITTNSPTGRFDTSNGGSFTSTSLTLQILQGFQNTPDFFYKDTKAGNPAIIATVTATNGVPNLPIGYAAGLGATVNPAPAANMTFSTPPFQSVAGQCANSYGQPITVMLQDSFGNGGASPSVSKTINLTSSSGSGVFYSDPQCTVPITNVVIPTNGSSAKFYYKDTTAGTPVITASDSANIFPAVTQTETILPNFSVCSSLTFAPSSFNVGTTPFHSVTSDFNGDGKLDIAVANQSSNNISILLGNGTGGFTASTTGGIGSGPGSVAVGDFNSDGKVDLVTANVGGSFSLLFGNGTGSYPSASTFSMGSGPRSIAVGDFNGDGKDDIATANTGASSTVSVRLGNGAGNFGAVSTFTVGTFPRSIAVGDFNGDGKADLVTANDGSNNVSVLLGTGTGSFGAATNFSAGNSSTSVAIGDFNGDGKADLATANAGS
ncbi:MAG TPA: VCBS repeat-containing protein, partial [Sphingobacteriaceae bacterium]